jgi:hypothetical protein
VAACSCFFSEAWNQRQYLNTAIHQLYIASMDGGGPDLEIRAARTGHAKKEKVLSKADYAAGSLVLGFPGTIIKPAAGSSLQKHQIRIPASGDFPQFVLDWSMHLLPTRMPFCWAGKVLHTDDQEQAFWGSRGPCFRCPCLARPT